MAADRVLVLDDGVITAEDTHRNLLSTDETYRLTVTCGFPQEERVERRIPPPGRLSLALRS